MKIRIYQINEDRDTNGVIFFGLGEIGNLQGNKGVDSSIYDRVFEGNVDCSNLEEVYQMFNIDPPSAYNTRSLSVSDVVEVISDEGKSKFNFCDIFGFKDVDFDPDKCRDRSASTTEKKESKISVIFVSAGKYPKVIEIDDTLEAMQKLVDGYIEEYMPFEDEVAIICNEEGKIRGLDPNRAIYAEPNDGSGGEKGEMIEIICGDFLVAYAPIDSPKFKSLPSDLMAKYKEKFHYPQQFIKLGNEIKAIPYKPKHQDMSR